jgi:phosphate-selective porin OprO/OprP
MNKKMLFILFALLQFDSTKLFAQSSTQRAGEIDLETRIKQLELKLDSLAAQKSVVPENSTTAVKQATPIAPILAIDKNIVTVLENAKIGGFIQVDGRWYSETGTVDTKKDGADVRRARLTLSGSAGKDFIYRFQNDFGAGTITDAFMAYQGIANTEFKIGNFKPPFSLEKIIGIPNVTFVERSIITASTPARLTGFQAAKFGSDWQAALGVFGEGFGNQNRTDDSNYSLSARATYAPINNDNALLHVGLSGSYYSKNRNTKTVSAGNVTADPMDSESYLDFELVGRIKSVYLQSEYIINHVNYDNDAQGSGVSSTTGLKADYNSYYVQASWFVTGDTKEYRLKTGDFNTVKIKNSYDKGGTGAWELAARFSSLDQNDSYRGTNITQGKTNEVTFAVNWYPNNYLRLMVNYQKANTSMREQATRKYDAFSVRTQVMF